MKDHKNELSKYGPGKWALITGASEGIGLAYAKELVTILATQDSLNAEILMYQSQSLSSPTKTQ